MGVGVTLPRVVGEASEWALERGKEQVPWDSEEKKIPGNSLGKGTEAKCAWCTRCPQSVQGSWGGSWGEKPRGRAGAGRGGTG